MDKCREAFEQIPEIAERIKRSKMEYNSEHDFFHAPEWDSQSCSDQDFVNNFRKGWQSRQPEVDSLKDAIDRQGKLAIQSIQEAHKASRLELSIAKDIQASLKPELIESERQMNAQLTDENMKLEARIDLLQKVICLHLDDRFLNVDWALGGNNANS